MANQLTNPLGGRGTTGTVAKWSSPTTIGDSILTDSGTAISSSGPIRATGTSAAAPAFTGSDTDTGIYFPAANQVRIATSGSLAIAVDASQNVGIGTASPVAPMHVVGTSVASVTTSSPGILRVDGGAVPNKLFFGSFSGSPFGMYAQTNDATYPLVLQPAGGSVGIGTTSPIGTFEVRAANPTIVCSNSPVRYGYSVWHDGTSEFRTGTGNAHAFVLLTNNIERMRIDSTGNVGIGTASPGGKLAILHSATNPNGLSNSTAIGALVLTNDGATAGSAYIRSANIGAAAYDTGLQFGCTFYDGVSYKWTERMCIKATGEVGIGTTSPTAALHLPASTTARASLNITSGAAPTSPNNGDIWFDGTNIKMRIGGVTKTFTLV